MGKPYAKVDVALRDHPKAVEVGPAAMGIWLGALLYIREHLTDGFAPRQVVFSSFAASPQLAACCVRRLVSAGLFVEVPGGFLLANYSEKNQTKVQVTAAIDSARERMRRVRESRKCS